MSESKLTAKQEAFCREYLIDLNATQAAIRAGYEVNEVPPSKGYYTYALISNLTGKCFYIGKGKGSRVYNHERDRLKKGNSDKNEELNKAIDSGAGISNLILSVHSDESEAYAIEDCLIDYIGIDNLTNQSRADRSKARSNSTLLPSIYDYEVVSCWARDCLSILTPLVDNGGRIYYLGATNEYIHTTLLDTLNECLSNDMRVA